MITSTNVSEEMKWCVLGHKVWLNQGGIPRYNEWINQLINGI